MKIIRVPPSLSMSLLFPFLAGLLVLMCGTLCEAGAVTVDVLSPMLEFTRKILVSPRLT